jgi:ABC-type molybdate transport system substrate-binding protein
MSHTSSLSIPAFALLLLAACSPITPPSAVPTGLPTAAPAIVDTPTAVVAAPAPPPTVAPIPAGGPAVLGEIVVFAASSLTDAFQDIAAAFQQANPNAEVTFQFRFQFRCIEPTRDATRARRARRCVRVRGSDPDG